MTPSEAQQPAAAATTAAPDAKVVELLAAFRQLVLQHGRVIIHESDELSMGATDIRALFFINEVGDGATPKQVAEFLELSTGATTSLVDRLVDAGTLERGAHPTDRRSVVLHITDSGHAAVAKVANVYSCALESVIPESSYDATAELFRKLAGALTTGSGCYAPRPV